MTTQNTNPPSLSIIQDIINHIEDNMLHKITPVTIAKQFLISDSTLSTLFKALCGVAVKKSGHKKYYFLVSIFKSGHTPHF